MMRLLVIRLSAMGDVAMTVPVIEQVLASHENIQIDVLTRSNFEPIFPKHERLHFIFPDLNGRHKGFFGLFRLYRELKKNHYKAVVDLHNVLRSQVLRFFFLFNKSKVAHIDKGRSEKKALTRKDNKVIKALKTTHARYVDVFLKAGFPIQLNTPTYFIKSKTAFKIGIAPFAAHKQKMWPIEKSKSLVRHLLTKYDGQIYLFGGGAEERAILKEIATTSDRIISTAEQSFEKQLDLIATLDLMVSMDSANMHLASNAQVPVVSIWGATHPHAGFLSFGQSTQHCVQRDDLDCRPCSVFGNKTCWRGDWACLDIDTDSVLELIDRVISAGTSSMHR